MKKNNGITIISLTIYVIVLLMIVATLNVFTTHFFSNLNNVIVSQNVEEEYSELIAYLTLDINKEKLNYIRTGKLGEKQYLVIKLKNNEEHQYIYQNGNIYYINRNTQTPKKIKLCRNITSADNVFEYDNGLLNVKFSINGIDFQNHFNIYTE